MATSLLALLDDIATLLDDIAAMTKVAAKKTAGVLGDDLALNAQQVTGVHADRELPVVWAVAKGSLKNKAILVPSALLISAFLPKLVIILLIIGGGFLCFEGFEKILHKFLHKGEIKHSEIISQNLNLEQVEKDKIKGAIRTDFILSAEIIVITLGTVSAMSLTTQICVLIGIALIMTIGVYGLVAGIVKIDDLGLHMMNTSAKNSFKYTLGNFIINLAPYLMKSLAILGTLAMFMVGGSIVAHNVPFLSNLSYSILYTLQSINSHTLTSLIFSTIIDLVMGVLIGAIVFVAVEVCAKFCTKFKK